MANNFVTFKALCEFKISTFTEVKTWDGIIEWSTDKVHWKEFTGIAVCIRFGANLYLRGKNNTYLTTNILEGHKFYEPWIIYGKDISISGNIENLLDYEKVANGEHPTMAEYCYKNIFKNCTSLVKAPELPATELTVGCYESMFFNCISLIKAPKLPATKLAESCYFCMFKDCTSITTTPKLLATELAEECYSHMFLGCTSLIKVSKLPATELAKSSYQGMFRNCISLTKAPTFSKPIQQLITVNALLKVARTENMAGIFDGTDISMK